MECARPRGRRWVPGTALAALALAGAACAPRPSSAGRWSSWSRLEFEAEAGTLLSGRVELSLRDSTAGRILATRATARVLGATIGETTTESELDPQTGRTRFYRSYSAKRGRRYEFGESGYSVERLRRADEEWEIDSRAEFAYPDTGAGPAAVHDYYGMLLRLRDLKLHAPGDEAAIFVATSDGPRGFRIRVDESRTRQRSFTDLARGQQRTESLRELRLRLAPDDPEADEGFLRMEGETEVWVEAESKTPLEIGGKVPNVPGRVRLLLTGIE